MAANALILVCAADRLRDGADGVRFPIRWLGAAATGFVVRHEGRVHGYVNQCPHVATELDWQPGAFFAAGLPLLICATHGALFEPATGRCAGGPCTGRGGLRALQVVECDGGIYWRPDAAAEAPG